MMLQDVKTGQKQLKRDEFVMKVSRRHVYSLKVPLQHRRKHKYWTNEGLLSDVHVCVHNWCTWSQVETPACVYEFYCKP